MGKLKKETRIKREKTRLIKKYENLPESTLSIVDGLIDQAAFMRIELEDMNVDMLENGRIEMFSQSEKTKPYERERPVSRQYNQMIKNYQNIIKQLDDKLPVKIEVEESDGFDDFIDGG